MAIETIDTLQLNFSPSTLTALNVILGLIMFGVALDLKIADFKRALSRPRAFFIGVFSQFLLLPAAAFGLTYALDVGPSVALGMIMVAACPGGNISNFMTSMARGSTALSVCMTAVSTTASIFLMPINVTFWASQRADTAQIMRELAVDPLSMLGSVVVMLGIPLAVGLLISEKKPELAQKMKKPFKIGSLVFFGLLVVVAFGSNLSAFVDYIGVIFMPVAVLNAVALSIGYTMARLGRLTRPEARAVSIEVGIQNSGLGLVLIFAHFDGLGGMAAVAAWWGIWHIVSGLGAGFIWSRFFPLSAEELEYVGQTAVATE
jgi:BASS family bile acid:Na+ symporter